MDDPENKVSEDESCESEKKDFSNPVYQELSRINGRINSMTKEQLITNLNKLQLDPNGNLTIMRKRLKNHIRMQKLASNNLTRVIKQFPFYVVIDFEATCEPYNPPDYPHEIIEFPAILVDSEKQTVIDEFHSFVKPVKYPKLSDFCIELTGITQETVDKSEEFPKVLNKFLKWLKKHGLDSKSKYAIVTDGPCDMGRFMLGQCNMCDIPYPYFAKNWINIRRVFSSHYKSKNKLSLASMLQSYGVEFDGRLHSGLDDSRNIANLLIHMIKDGVSVDINENIQANQMIDRRSRPNNKRKGSTTFKINQPRNYQQNQPQDQKVDVKIDQEDLDFALGLMSVRNEVGGKLSDS